MSLEIGGVTVPPIFPAQPADGGETPPASSEGETTPNVGAEDGGPDAVYEPSAPEDGEPLTYSNPYAVTLSGNGDDGDGSEDIDVAGEEGGDTAGEVTPDDNGGDPYVEAASDLTDSGTVSGEDAVPPLDIAPEPAVGDGEPAGPPDEPEPAEDASGGIEDWGGANGADGVPPEEGGVDPSVQDGSGDGATDPAVEGDASSENHESEPVSSDSTDPAAGLLPATDDAVAGPDGDEAAPLTTPTSQPAAASQVSIPTRPRREVVDAKDTPHPTLAAALSPARSQHSLALQVSQAIALETNMEAPTFPVQSVGAVQTVRAPAPASPPLLAVSDVAPATAQAEAPKVISAVMAQAAYSFVQTAQTNQSSVLSFRKFG